MPGRPGPRTRTPAGELVHAAAEGAALRIAGVEGRLRRSSANRSARPAFVPGKKDLGSGEKMQNTSGPTAIDNRRGRLLWCWPSALDAGATSPQCGPRASKSPGTLGGG